MDAWLSVVPWDMPTSRRLSFPEFAAHVGTHSPEHVQALLAQMTPRAHLATLLQEAACCGDVRAIEALVAHLGPCRAGHEALTLAAEEGHLAAVRALIPSGHPSGNHSEALVSAAIKGHVDIVAALIPVSRPKADDSAALRMAAQLGNTDVVELLLPVSDPTANHSEAFLTAIREEWWDLTELLRPFPHEPVALCQALVGATRSTERDRTDEQEGLLGRLLATCGEDVVDRACDELLSRRDFPAVERVLAHTSAGYVAALDLDLLKDAPALQARWHARALEGGLPVEAAERSRLRL